MAKYIFTRPNGPWQYPTLGFTATLNDVIEANAAPDLWWELTDSGATVTLPAVPTIPGVVEPVDGAIGRWNRQTNEVEFVAQLPDENLPDRLQEAALASTYVSVGQKGALTGVALTGRVDLRNFYDVTSPPSDFSTALTAMCAAADAAGAWAYIPYGDFPGEITLTDKSLRLVCDGRIVQIPSKGVIRWENYPGARRAITGVGTIDLTSQATAGDQMPHNERLNTVTFPDGIDISDIQYGDQFWIESDDRYPGSFVEGSDSKTYQRRWFQVAGIALNCTATGGGFNPDTTITGATSGATAYVRSVANRYGGSKTLKLHSMTGMFVSGENVTVSGVTVGSVSYRPFLLTRDDWGFVPSWSTNVYVRKIDTTRKVDIRGLRMVTQTAFDSASANNDAIVIRGAFDPIIEAHADSAYSRFISLESCRGGVVRASGGFLGNNTVAGKYGYGVQVVGATQDTVVVIDGMHDARHAFTTNVYPQYNPASGDPEFNTLGIPTTGVKVFRSGVPRDVDVSGSAYNMLGAPFDTHGGAERTRFHDFYLHGGGSGAEVATRSAGINNRGFGTIVENGTIAGFTWGWQDSAYKVDTGGPTFIRGSNVKMRDIVESGFRHGSDTSGGDTSRGRVTYLLEDIDVQFKTIPFGGLWSQTAFDLSISGTTIIRPVLHACNFAYVNIRNNVYDLTIIDPILNLIDAPGATVQLNITMSGAGVAVGDTITGATSGATGVATSVSGSTVYVTPTGTANFQNAENITVGGVTVGTTAASPSYPAGYFLRFSGTVSSSRRAVVSNVKILENPTGNALRFVFFVNSGQTGRVRRDSITVMRPGGSGPSLSGGSGTYDTATSATL